MIRVGKLSNDEIILAFLNNFVGYSAFERKRLMQEHIRRTLRELGVKERYKLVPDREI